MLDYPAALGDMFRVGMSTDTTKLCLLVVQTTSTTASETDVT